MNNKMKTPKEIIEDHKKKCVSNWDVETPKTATGILKENKKASSEFKEKVQECIFNLNLPL